MRGEKMENDKQQYGKEGDGQSMAKAIVEIANAYQADAELRILNRALKGFAEELRGDCKLDIEAQRDLETIALFLEQCESRLNCALDGARFTLGFEEEDLPEPNV
jgi:hypothetical protein